MGVVFGDLIASDRKSYAGLGDVANSQARVGFNYLLICFARSCFERNCEGALQEAFGAHRY